MDKKTNETEFGFKQENKNLNPSKKAIFEMNKKLPSEKNMFIMKNKKYS